MVGFLGGGVWTVATPRGGDFDPQPNIPDSVYVDARGLGCCFQLNTKYIRMPCANWFSPSVMCVSEIEFRLDHSVSGCQAISPAHILFLFISFSCSLGGVYE